jgi:hypothetical protein
VNYLIYRCVSTIAINHCPAAEWDVTPVVAANAIAMPGCLRCGFVPPCSGDE